MQTINDERLSTVSRVYQSGGRDVIAVSVLGAFSFGDKENPTQFLPEAEVWGLAAPVVESGMALEEGMAKPGREFFVAGSAYAPPGKKAQAVVASARVGDLQRTLRVTGDRQWGRTGPGEAEPFAAMPIDWQHAWGGPDVPDNPLGKGAAGKAADVPIPLPNVFDPRETPGAAGQRIAPASFLPVGSGWQARSDKPVTKDAAWLAGGDPGLPPDFDRSWFFTAHPDQRGAGQFSPGEEFSLAGMHPEREVVAGRLPSDMPWARVERQTADGVAAETVPLRLDTVWLFPDQEKGILVWHGETAAGDDEASEVVALRSGFGPQPAEVMDPIEDELPAEEPPPPPAAPPPPEPPKAEAVPVEAPPVDVQVEEVLPDAQPEVPAAEPVLTPEQRQAKAVADARDELHGAIDDFAADPTLQNPGQEMDMFNDILQAKGVPPVDMDSYQQALTQRINDMHDMVDALPDDVILQSLPLDQRFAGLGEQDARSMLASRFTDELNMPPGDAQALTDKLFSPPEIDFSKPVSAILADDFGVDIASTGLSADLLDNPDASMPSRDEAVAKIDKFMRDNMGTTFDAYMNQIDGGNVSLPLQTQDDIANLLGSSELAEKMSPLLPVLQGDMTNAAQAVANAGDAMMPPDDLELRDSLLQKYMPAEDYAAYKQSRVMEPSPLKADAVQPQAAMLDKPLPVGGKVEGELLAGRSLPEFEDGAAGTAKWIEPGGKQLPAWKWEGKDLSAFPEFQGNPEELRQWFGPDGEPLPGFDEYLRGKGIASDDPRLASLLSETPAMPEIPEPPAAVDPNAIPGPPGMDPLDPLPPPDDIFGDASK